MMMQLVLVDAPMWRKIIKKLNDFVAQAVSPRRDKLPVDKLVLPNDARFRLSKHVSCDRFPIDEKIVRFQNNQRVFR